MLVIHEIDQDGFYFCCHLASGQLGLVPCNYVRKVKEAEFTTKATASANPMEDNGFLPTPMSTSSQPQP